LSVRSHPTLCGAAAINIDLDDDCERERARGEGPNPLCCLAMLTPPGSSSMAILAGGNSAITVNAAGSDFQMSSCLIHRTGALVLETIAAPDDAWLSSGPAVPAVTAALLQDTLGVPASPVGLAVPEEDDIGPGNGSGDESGMVIAPEKLPLLLPPPPLPDPSAFDGGATAATEANGRGTPNPATIMEAKSALEDAAIVQTPSRLINARTHTMELRQRRLLRGATTVKRDVDFVIEEWVLLDPHDAGAASLRPFRHGKTYRIPAGLSQLSQRKKKPAAAEKDGAVTDEEGITAVRVRAPFFEEFDELYEAEMKRRRAALVARHRSIVNITVAAPPLIAAATATVVPVASVADVYERLCAEEALFEQPYALVAEDTAGSIDNSDNDDYGAAGVCLSQPSGATIADESVISAIDNDVSAVGTGSTATPIIATSSMEDMYTMEMSKEVWRLEQIQTESRRIEERRRQELGLAARISEWHIRLEPIIEAQEARRGFDIQECAQELLEAVERHHQQIEQDPTV